MEEDKVASLVRPLEVLAAEKPGLYRLRVGLLAALGYVYLLVIVLALLGIIAVTLFYVRVNWVMLKVLWIPLALVGLVLALIVDNDSGTRWHEVGARTSARAV